jgi:hypothetical protein
VTAPEASIDTALRVGIVLLTMATALIHLQLAFPDPAFILNGLGTCRSRGWRDTGASCGGL